LESVNAHSSTAINRIFPWGAGVFEDLWQTQLAWNQLSQNFRDALTAFWPINAEIFPNRVRICATSDILNTRTIKYCENRVIMPVVELVNHGSHVAGYDRKDGIAVEGIFAEESALRLRQRRLLGYSRELRLLRCSKLCVRAPGRLQI